LKPHPTSTSTELSWTCAVVAAASGAGAICLACISSSPIDPLSIFGALLFGVGTILGGSLGTLLGVIGAIRCNGRATDRILPAAINIVVVAGFWLTIFLLRPGPSFKGGPAGF
jgi:hypothetical protein